MAAKANKIQITLVKSTIHQLPSKRKTVEALGLRKINSSVVKIADPAILGMVKCIKHLVKVEEVKS
ncbi:MAG: 50S ribosomal protein L30 [Spirochaetaceae bacterium]|nr:MAG: 50S ribosomal protein L30 [Spirochaetaceae bacterium]